MYNLLLLHVPVQCTCFESTMIDYTHTLTPTYTCTCTCIHVQYMNKIILLFNNLLCN